MYTKKDYMCDNKVSNIIPIDIILHTSQVYAKNTLRVIKKE